MTLAVVFFYNKTYYTLCMVRFLSTKKKLYKISCVDNDELCRMNNDIQVASDVNNFVISCIHQYDYALFQVSFETPGNGQRTMVKNTQEPAT